MPRHILALVTATLLAGWSIAARATVLVPADLVELSRGAVLIVRGTVTSVTPQWSEGRRRVESVVMVDVQQALKGEPGKTLAFKVPGGRLGRYRSVMVGAPSFREGEEVILFLGARPPAVPYLLGLGQGVYRVQRDERTGEPRVVSPVLVAGAGQPQRVQRGDPARRALSLDEFASQVRNAIAAGEHDRERRVPGASRGRNR